jgi:hypothetical protein
VIRPYAVFSAYCCEPFKGDDHGKASRRPLHEERIMPTPRMASANRQSIMGLMQRRFTPNIMRIMSGAMKDGAYGVDTLFAQITHAAPSASRKETSLLPVCCLCRLIRDEIGSALDSARWVTQRTYRKTHSVNPANCLQTHTYCPGCFTQAMESIRGAQVTETPKVA